MRFLHRVPCSKFQLERYCRRIRLLRRMRPYHMCSALARALRDCPRTMYLQSNVAAFSSLRRKHQPSTAFIPGVAVQSTHKYRPHTKLSAKWMIPARPLTSPSRIRYATCDVPSAIHENDASLYTIRCSVEGSSS